MNQLVLSGTAALVLSGTQSSCYRGPKSSLRACFSALFSPSNFPNQTSFGFLLTDPVTSRIGGKWQRRAVSHACVQKAHTHFTDRKAHGSRFQLQGSAA